MGITISVCIPCHNRTYDLRHSMPNLLLAANYSPPIEIVVVDYNSQDNLREYFKTVMTSYLQDGNSLTYRRYTGRDYYHMAHARNLSVMASHGDYIQISSTDIYFDEAYFAIAREEIEENGYIWMHDGHYTSVLLCRTQEFIDAGGYDERFEFYGQEDKDLYLRMQRRGKKFGLLPRGLIHIIETPDEEKIKNYRIKSRREMFVRMRKIYEENVSEGALVANEGKEWGQWT